MHRFGLYRRNGVVALDDNRLTGRIAGCVRVQRQTCSGFTWQRLYLFAHAWSIRLCRCVIRNSLLIRDIRENIVGLVGVAKILDV